MKILHVIQRYWPYVGGSERYFQELSERLAARGHEVTVYTTTAYDLEYFWQPARKRLSPGTERLNGVTVTRFPVRHLPLSPLTYPALRRLVGLLGRAPGGERLALAAAAATPFVPELALRLATTRERYDLIHAGNIPFDAIVAWAQALARRRGIPFVMTPFTHLGEADNAAVRRHYTLPHQIALLRGCDAVFVQTALEGEFLTSLGVPRRAIRRGGVGVEPAEVLGGDRERFRRQHAVEGPLVTFLGTVAKDKGAVHLVEAMRRLWEQGLTATLALAGPTYGDFERYWAALPETVTRRCRLLGVTLGDAKRDLFAATDVFAMPSRTDSFGIVFLEAWTAGIAPVAARAGGVAEVIEDGVTGRLVEFGDVPALAEAIRALIADRALAARLAARGREKALADYTWEKVVGRVVAVYEELVG
ncbi:MAG: glycosyltransferase family 4 protein [Chloroflexota bacterium]|nr:glycosyltransferase family 4 protein [Dehalococcoidia bacterium]MDW8252381.1 glycosyltransferase family 4 protein [Chloroflexota bacterium]